MIGVRAFGLYQHRRSEDFQQLLDQVRRLKVGCVVVFESEVGSLPAAAQRAAAGLRRAPARRRGHGARDELPHPPRRRAPAQRDGAGRDAIGGGRALHGRGRRRAKGAPSACTGRSRPWRTSTATPRTPIINVRSYGEDPELVGRMTAAFVHGAHERRPADHGQALSRATATPRSDSHLQLATISGDRERLDARRAACPSATRSRPAWTR